jgi:hypothetical protein
MLVGRPACRRHESQLSINVWGHTPEGQTIIGKFVEDRRPVAGAP